MLLKLMGDSFIKLFSSILGILLVSGALVSMTTTASAAEVNYQGVLTDGTGGPVPDGFYFILFECYNDSTGGTLLWQETHPSVNTSGGYFTVLLGSIDPLPDGWFNGGSMPNVYLQFTVNDDGAMTPRTRISSVPQAMVAYRLKGDLITGPGMLEVHPPEPGAAGVPGFWLRMDSASSGWRLVPPTPITPEDSCSGIGGNSRS